MRAIRKRVVLLALSMFLLPVGPAVAQVSVAIGGPGFRIGINVPAYPRLVVVPGYPVYYAPAIDANYFFYDGLFWVYTGDDWYESAWFNGPWQLVSPDAIPVVILRVPVRYYRRPPPYFRGWARNAAPHWSEHWGNDWAQRRPNWAHRSTTAPQARAPLPSYQSQYSGNRYPHPVQQQQLESQHYHYQPHDAAVRPYYHDHARQPERADSRSHAQGDRHGENHADRRDKRPDAAEDHQ